MNIKQEPGDVVYADKLTWREQEVLQLLARRMTNREIADQLHLAESTVKDYVGKILSKLYVKNRRQAVERAKTLGLLNGDRDPAARPQINLPSEPTPFVGRLSELADIKQCFRETRLLTLTGPGGIGKSRLALKVAQDAIEDYSDGVFFASLAPIRSVDHLCQAIAEALRFPLAKQEDPQHQLLRYLRNKQLLLVMDNFEHLLDGAGIASEILNGTQKVKILATSRERLNLQGETIFSVGGMNYPYQGDLEDLRDYDAVALFVQNARKIQPGFELTPDVMEYIIDISQIVQGMPLAIELAATWLHILNVDEIAREMTKDLDILASEVRDAPRRHSSIRAVFDHSWSMLNETEKDIFTRLSVFRGGFTRQAAQKVTGASLQQLLDLANKSFMNHNPDNGRLEIHELLRQYGQEQLERDPDASISAHNKHADYYASSMQLWGQHLRDSRQMDAIAEIEADIENIRAAWRYYLEQINTPQLWKLITCIWEFYWIKWWNHAGMELFAEVVGALKEDVNPDAVPLRALAMAFQGYFMAWLDLADHGYELAKTGVDILESFNYPEALALAYECLAINAYMLNRYPDLIYSAQKMLELANEIGDEWVIAFSLFPLSWGELLREEYDEANRLAEKNLALYEEVGEMIGATRPLIILGHVSMARGELRKAREYYLRCLTLSQRTGFYYSLQTSSKYLVKVAYSLGNYPETKKYLELCLKITQEVGFVRDVILLIHEFAKLKMVEGNLVEATELLAFVIQHPASNYSSWLEGRTRDNAQDLLNRIRENIPIHTFTAAQKLGKEKKLENIIVELLGSTY